MVSLIVILLSFVYCVLLLPADGHLMYFIYKKVLCLTLFVSYSYITQHDVLSKDFFYFLCFVHDIEKNINQKAIYE